MKKRLLSVLLLVALLIVPLATPVHAYQSGDPIGDVLYTDIVAYIDGYPIRSYNINWNTYIVVEDLMAYGFGVTWIPEDGGRLIIAKERTAAPSAYTTTYQPEANTHTPGTVAMQYLYTNVTTWIGDTQVTGYNIGGYTCICMDDLAAHFADTYVWSAEESALYMTSPAMGTYAPEPAAAVEQYISAKLETAKSGQYSADIQAKLAEMEASAGKALVDEVLAVTRELNDTFSFEIVDSIANGTTAQVTVRVKHRDLSYYQMKYWELHNEELDRLAAQGKTLSDEEWGVVETRLSLQALGSESLPTAENTAVAYLDYVNNTWQLDIEAEKNADFAMALAVGIHDKPAFLAP